MTGLPALLLMALSHRIESRVQLLPIPSTLSVSDEGDAPAEEQKSTTKSDIARNRLIDLRLIVVIPKAPGSLRGIHPLGASYAEKVSLEFQGDTHR